MSLQEKMEMIYQQRKQAQVKPKKIFVHGVIITPKESARLNGYNTFIN